MSKVYCNRCGFAYEGGCKEHTPKQLESATYVVTAPTPEPAKKKSLLKRIFGSKD